MTSFNQQVIEEFRANQGVVGGYLAGDAMMILTVIGAKSGLPREVPLVYGADGDRFLVIASNGGEAADPLWYRNLRANPRARVEVGTETFEVWAATLTGDERRQAWEAMLAATPRFANYQARTARELPVVALSRLR